MYDVRCTIYDLRFTIYDLRFTIYDLRFTIYDLRFTIYDSKPNRKSIVNRKSKIVNIFLYLCFIQSDCHVKIFRFFHSQIASAFLFNWNVVLRSERDHRDNKQLTFRQLAETIGTGECNPAIIGNSRYIYRPAES
jgi:hypothetical protein